MANEIRHASATKPRIYPWNGDTQPMDIDRVQSISGGVNQPLIFILAILIGSLVTALIDVAGMKYKYTKALKV